MIFVGEENAEMEVGTGWDCHHTIDLSIMVSGGVQGHMEMHRAEVERLRDHLTYLLEHNP